MISLRPVDLAREHGLSTQAVRNYEAQGLIPPAHRSTSGFRRYETVHVQALTAYRALVPAFGYDLSRQIMRALNSDAIEDALAAISHGHAILLRDRATLDAVTEAVERLAAMDFEASRMQPPPSTRQLSIGELAHRLGVTMATLRNWERAGILKPGRDGAGHRSYDAHDVRDAELSHLLRRGKYPLRRIAEVVEQVRDAGGTRELAAALIDWRRRLTLRGVRMLTASADLGRYLEARGIGVR